MTSKRTIAFIGCGTMGAAMAGHLIDAGHELRVFNRTPEKCTPLVARGAQLAPDVACAVRDADVVITMVGTPSDVEDLYLSHDGILEVSAPGAYLIDMTTSSPQLARDISEVAELSGKHAFDAPVTGGPQGAAAGTLTIFCGTDAETLAGAMVGFAEGLAFAKQAGLDLAQTLDALAGGMADSKALSTFGPKVLAGDYAPGFTVDHYLKDIDLIEQTAESMELTLPGVDTARDLYGVLSAIGAGKLGTQAVALMYEDEQTCASHGLDWSALGTSDFDEDEEHGHAGGDTCGCDHDHDHGDACNQVHDADDDDEDFEDFDFAQAYGLESFYDPSGSRE